MAQRPDAPRFALPPPAGPTGDARVTSMQPWLAYNDFCRGVTIEEISMRGDVDARLVRADIEQMRAWIRTRFKTFTDDECDAWRRAELLYEKAYAEGSSGSLRLIADCNEKMETLERADRARAAMEEEN